MSESPTRAIARLEHVTVRYANRPALSDVSVEISSGVVGLLGPNGAGKTTLLRAALGFIRPDEGRMRVLDLDVTERGPEIRSRLGYMPESDAHIPGMNGVAFVAYCGQLSGLPHEDAIQRAHEMLYYVGLGEARYRNLETYSAGMKQRIKLAQALVHDPDLLLLDEPTNGMDPKGRGEMLELIRDIGHRKGIDLILSSHLLPDVEYACDRAVVIDAGRVVAHGPIADLKGPAGRTYEVRVKGDPAAFAEALTAAGLECRSVEDEVTRVFVPEDVGVQRVFALAAEQGLQVRHLRPSTPTLEDAFARAVGVP